MKLKAAKKSVTEGDVLKLTATVGQVKTAKRVTLERWEPNSIWSGGRWVSVKARKVKRRVVFKTTVTTENRARYRVSVTYRKRSKPVVSKAASVTVWRWIPLRGFTPYQSNVTFESHDALVNGRSRRVWGPFAYTGSAWESRYTPGRNCSAFRGAAGLKDSSGDGATGLVEFSAEGKVLWRSPVLVPGRLAPFKVALKPKPYRVALAAVDTSDTPGVRALPVVADPELYCTGI